jgi:hypothetical protein
MTIGRWFLPKRVNLRLTALFDHLRKARRFNLEKLHCRTLTAAHSRRRAGLGRSTRIKSARELRQEGSYYRCCIPALAGFVSPQSIAPDGEPTFSQESQGATANSKTFDDKIGALSLASQQPARGAVRSSALRRRSQHARGCVNAELRTGTPLSRMGDSLLCALHRCYARYRLCLSGVCALQFSQPTNDVAKSALATPCRAR